MTNTIRALQNAIGAMEKVNKAMVIPFKDLLDAIPQCKSALSEIEKCEPVAKLGRWKIDKSTGTEILTLDNCSVIEGKYAHYIMGLLQKEIDKVVSELENTSPQPRECEDWQYFDKAYKKATESSEPDDWMNAALLAQQVRRIQLNTKG